MKKYSTLVNVPVLCNIEDAEEKIFLLKSVASKMLSLHICLFVGKTKFNLFRQAWWLSRSCEVLWVQCIATKLWVWLLLIIISTVHSCTVLPHHWPKAFMDRQISGSKRMASTVKKWKNVTKQRYKIGVWFLTLCAQ